MTHTNSDMPFDPSHARLAASDRYPEVVSDEPEGEVEDDFADDEDWEDFEDEFDDEDDEEIEDWDEDEFDE